MLLQLTNLPYLIKEHLKGLITRARIEKVLQVVLVGVLQTGLGAQLIGVAGGERGEEGHLAAGRVRHLLLHLLRGLLLAATRLNGHQRLDDRRVGVLQHLHARVQLVDLVNGVDRAKKRSFSKLQNSPHQRAVQTLAR